MAVEKPMTLAISLFPLILHGGPCLRMSFHTAVDGSCKWPLVQNCRVRNVDHHGELQFFHAIKEYFFSCTNNFSALFACRLASTLETTTLT